MSIEQSKAIALCVAAAAASSAVTALLLCKSSACGAAAAAAPKVEDPKESRETYETDASARQYMEFHFTPGSQLYPRNAAIDLTKAFDFPLRVARKFAEFKPRDGALERGLDLGCATGASVFEMSKFFAKEVVGIDLSSAFIRCAEELAKNGTASYSAPEQGLVTLPRTTGLPAGAQPAKCKFLVGDALDVPAELGVFDGLLAANLLCRVPEPRKLLDSFAHLIRSGGVLVLVSPYSWWEGATHKSKWIGGKPGDRRSEELVKEILGANFTLVSEADEPFVIRDHGRRFQLGFSHCTVWIRK